MNPSEYSDHQQEYQRRRAEEAATRATVREIMSMDALEFHLKPSAERPGCIRRLDISKPTRIHLHPGSIVAACDFSEPVHFVDHTTAGCPRPPSVVACSFRSPVVISTPNGLITFLP